MHYTRQCLKFINIAFKKNPTSGQVGHGVVIIQLRSTLAQNKFRETITGKIGPHRTIFYEKN